MCQDCIEYSHLSYLISSSQHFCELKSSYAHLTTQETEKVSNLPKDVEPDFQPRCPFPELLLFLHPHEVECREKNFHWDHFTSLPYYRETLDPFSKFIKKKRQRGV